MYNRQRGLWVTILLPNGKEIVRKVKFFILRNFCENIVRIKNKEYVLGHGDEYLRGYKCLYHYSEDLREIKSLQ